MIRRINNYLLTRYPLAWNLRLPWVLSISLLIHLCFFTAGFYAVKPDTLRFFYTISNVGGEGMFFLSVFCSLVVIIGWGLFYLRNNALKHFYQLDRWYLPKEFTAIFLILFTSSVYFMSYQSGVRTRIRSFTNLGQAVRETNTVNAAAAYVPLDRERYFLLNNCADYTDREATSVYYNINDTLPNDTTVTARALRRPDAFSYRNYCSNFINSYLPEVTPAALIGQQNVRRLQNNRRDSIRMTLDSFHAILDRYQISYLLPVDTLLKDVFSDSLFTVNLSVDGSGPNAFISEHVATETLITEGKDTSGKFLYLDVTELNNTFELLEGAQLTEHNRQQWNENRIIAAYVSCFLSILLLCYRRFSRKVFLISVLGSLVWTILLGLLLFMGIHETGMQTILLLLSTLFLIVACGFLLPRQRRKTLTGVLLNWHLYILPFMYLLVLTYVYRYYDNAYPVLTQLTDQTDRYMRTHFPISYWFTHHDQLLAVLNLLICYLYIAFPVNYWAKRWQAMPEE